MSVNIIVWISWRKAISRNQACDVQRPVYAWIKKDLEVDEVGKCRMHPTSHFATDYICINNLKKIPGKPVCPCLFVCVRG